MLSGVNFFILGVLRLSDETYMKLALEYAEKGCGWVNPNPMVGAVVVKDDREIGKGYHQRFGELHAERNALASCTEPPRGATLYVTLEPCCHYGKTPPCTDAILESGIRRVVVGSVDPNPLVGGKGIQILREHGIEVTEGVSREACAALNEVFFHFIRTRMPYVVMKYAMTMDGKIATYSGQSKWITGEAARRRVQEDRHRYSASSAHSSRGRAFISLPIMRLRTNGSTFSPVKSACSCKCSRSVSARRTVIFLFLIFKVFLPSCALLRRGFRGQGPLTRSARSGSTGHYLHFAVKVLCLQAYSGSGRLPEYLCRVSQRSGAVCTLTGAFCRGGEMPF